MTKSMQEIQTEAGVWLRKNFGSPPEQLSNQLLGVVEEVGELSHAHLKASQGIRRNEDHEAKRKDAIGDIVIYLMNYCTTSGLDFETCVREVWSEVMRRDWAKHPETGEGPGAMPKATR